MVLLHTACMARWHGRWRQGQTEHNGVVLHKQKALDYAEENKAKLAQVCPNGSQPWRGLGYRWCCAVLCCAVLCCAAMCAAK